MIHQAVSFHAMRKARTLGLVLGPMLGLATALGGCASSTKYPSFAMPAGSQQADSEAGSSQGRVAMRFPGVAVPEIRADASAQDWSEELPVELDARLAAINARAMAAGRAFSAGLGPAQQLARIAAGSAVETDSWSTAQLRLADLTSHHSNAHLALAELDRLAATVELAASRPADATDIAELRTKLAQDVGEQARLLAQISAQLAP